MAVKTFNVNSISYTPVITNSWCAKIEIYENNQAGTTDYLVSDSGSDGTAITRPAGSKLTIYRVCPPNQTVIYVKSVTGSVVFAQEENAR